MKKNILVFAFLLLPSLVQAYGAVNSTVNSVRIDRSGKGMVEFDSPIGNNPASCGTQTYASYLSFDTNTDGGKAIYSMVLAAAASGKKIVAYGTGTCADYSNVVESLSYAHFVK